MDFSATPEYTATIAGNRDQCRSRPGAWSYLLHLHPTTAVRWVRDAGGDWNRYAAQLAQARDHQP